MSANQRWLLSVPIQGFSQLRCFQKGINCCLRRRCAPLTACIYAYVTCPRIAARFAPVALRHIARQPMPCAPRQQRKCRRFLGFGRQSEGVAVAQSASQRFEPRGQHLHQRPVARAAAGDDEIHGVALHARLHVTRVAPRNRLRSQGRRGRQRIVGVLGLRHALLQKLGGVSPAELLAPCGLWRAQFEIRMPQRVFQHGLDHSSARRQRPIAIERFVEQLLRQPVDDHVAGPGIEGDHCVGRSSGRNGSQVGDAADVLQNAPALRIGEEHIVQKRDQRSALAARQHVGRAEVRDHRNAQLRGDRLRLARLPRARKFSARVVLRARLVVERLAVATDQIEPQLVLSGGLLHRLRIRETQPPVEPRQFGR